jgi:hypothetical protein
MLVYRSNARIAAMLEAPGASQLMSSTGFEPSADGDLLHLPQASGQALSLIAGALQLLDSSQQQAQPTQHKSSKPVDQVSAPASAAKTTPAQADAVNGKHEAPSEVAATAASRDELENARTGISADAAEPKEALGMSAEAWRARQGKHAKAIPVGGKPVEAASRPAVAAGASLGQQGGAAESSPLPEAPEPFTGRNTKVWCRQLFAAAPWCKAIRAAYHFVDTRRQVDMLEPKQIR